MDKDFVGAFELEYGRMVDFSRILNTSSLSPHWVLPYEYVCILTAIYTFS